LTLVFLLNPHAGASDANSQLPVRQKLPAFVAVDLADKSWRLSDLKGRAVLINFWATWCEPCLAEMPSLQSLAQQYGPDTLVVLLVNFKQSPQTIQPRFLSWTRTSGPLAVRLGRRNDAESYCFRGGSTPSGAPPVVQSGA
jgi:thiol-disulfide isomerase/thioredoxin